MLTIKDCVSQLPADSHALVVAMHVAATAPDRHAARVAAAEAAARAALPAPCTDGLVATLLSVEAGGVGGRGGITGDSTERMSWATALGKGRRNATDGDAWTAAIKAAARHLQEYDPDCDDVAVLSTHLSAADLAWPLAYCLRRAYEMRRMADVASRWAAVATDIAARCEPDDRAGRLAARYGLTTLTQRYRAVATLRAETVSELTGVDESALVAGQVANAGALIELLHATEISCYGQSEPAWTISISGRDPDALASALQRAWGWIEGEEERDFIALHAALFPGTDAVDLAAQRDRWDAAAAAAPSGDSAT